MPPTALITGCGTGFGHELAAALLARGHRVLATDPAPEGLRASLITRVPEAAATLEVATLDVRDAAAVHGVMQRVGPELDLLVNNAGYAFFAPIEEGDPDAFRDLLDVNVVGLARMTRAALPALRAARGTVVMLSSVAGRTVFAESGFYAATKHAVEALSEALHQETCALGVRVRVIEPGSFDTEFLPTAAQHSPARTPDSPYALLRQLWDARKLAVLEPPQPPQLVVHAILESLEDPTAFARVPVGADARRLLGLREVLSPDAWVRLAADRHGLAPAPHAPGEVLRPDEVLAIPPEEDDRLAATRAALAHGQLDWWEDLPGASAAHARLRQKDVIES